MIIVNKDASDHGEAELPKLLCGFATRPALALAIDRVDVEKPELTQQISTLRSNPGRSAAGSGDRAPVGLAHGVPQPWANNPFVGFQTNGRCRSGDPLLDTARTHYPASLACTAGEGLLDRSDAHQRKDLGGGHSETRRLPEDVVLNAKSFP